MKSKLLLILLVISIGVHSQNFNKPVPGQFPNFEFIIHDSTYTGDYLTSPFILGGNTKYNRSIAIMDSLGYLMWYANTPANKIYTDFKYNEKLKMFSFAHGGVFKLLDSTFTLVDSITETNDFTSDSHEFRLLNNGNLLISGKSDSVVDLSAHTFDGVVGSDTTHIVGFTIQEFDSNHNLLFQWNSNDHIDPLESYPEFYGYDTSAFDYCHGNSIEKDTDGNYLVSMRHTNSIYKIDKNTGKIIWRLGGKISDFTFPNDNGFSGQHDFRRLANGNVSLFDNSVSSGSPRVSRGVEYILDTMNHTATKVWEYVHDTSLYSRAMGSNQRLASNYSLLGYGLVFRPHPNFVLLDDLGNSVSELYYLDSVMSYRAHTYNIPNNYVRPKVDCSKIGGLIELSAPSGESSYLWSTGDTTQNIRITGTGTYQVWTKKGIGMMGSYPIIVEDLNTFCNKTSISVIREREDLLWEIELIYDHLGRQINSPQKNKIYIVKYKNGAVRKEFWNEDRR